jgi:hypothetical protein
MRMLNLVIHWSLKAGGEQTGNTRQPAADVA